MSYVDNNLMQDEQVVYRARIHWLIFLPGLFWLLAAAALAVGGLYIVYLPIAAAVALAVALYHLLLAWIMRLSTELAVTSKRVILKQGLIKRDTHELNHSKVESFQVEQGILGRIFDFGNLTIHGTGGGRTPIRHIEAPLEFRRRAMEAIDASQRA